MNILFFLTPKSDVAYLYADFTLRQALEKMEQHRYSAVPVIDRRGEYINTLTEGDILWEVKERYELNFHEAEDVAISEIKRRMQIEPVSVNANIEDLMEKAMNQNFVPVIDDSKIFIGIVTRKDIIQYVLNEHRKVKYAKINN